METIDILTKVTKIQDNVVVVKATVINEGSSVDAHGTAMLTAEGGISGAVEKAEDEAVDRAKKLAGIKDE